MTHNKIITCVGAAFYTVLAADGFATNGYFTHGVGTHNKAMAGAGDAAPTMAIDAANNPAAGVLLDRRITREIVGGWRRIDPRHF